MTKIVTFKDIFEWLKNRKSILNLQYLSILSRIHLIYTFSEGLSVNVKSNCNQNISWFVFKFLTEMKWVIQKLEVVFLLENFFLIPYQLTTFCGLQFVPILQRNLKHISSLGDTMRIKLKLKAWLISTSPYSYSLNSDRAATLTV